MIFQKTLTLCGIIALAFCGCNRTSSGMNDDSIGIHLNRFDTVLFRWIDTDDPESLQTLINDYPRMLAMLSNALFKTNTLDSADFLSQMKNYYAEPALKALYKDAIDLFDANSPAIMQIEKELSHGFMQLRRMLPAMQTPAFYMHVSGLRQNMIVADSLLSFSIDKYLGADYPLYKDHFYNYQLKSMVPGYVVKDGLYAWLTSDYPFRGQHDVLLERMIYEGKIVCILVRAGYGYSCQHVMSLTDSEYKWCLKNESAIWKTIVERRHLETPDRVTVSKYFQSAPAVFISDEAPGNLGTFIGYRIVERYMKQTKTNCETLLNNSDARDIFKKSKYKP